MTGVIWHAALYCSSFTWLQLHIRVSVPRLILAPKSLLSSWLTILPWHVQHRLKPLGSTLKYGASKEHIDLLIQYDKYSLTFVSDLVEIVVWAYTIFDNNFGIQNCFTKYSKNRNLYCSDYLLCSRYFPNFAFTIKLVRLFSTALSIIGYITSILRSHMHFCTRL